MSPKKTNAISRREFLLKSGLGGSTGLLAANYSVAAYGAAELGVAAKSNSDVGSLFPIIQSEAIKGEFPLSFLSPKLKNLKRWKKEARGKLLELLHYSPERCDPRAEVVEKVDLGDFVREKIYFNTTP